MNIRTYLASGSFIFLLNGCIFGDSDPASQARAAVESLKGSNASMWIMTTNVMRASSPDQWGRIGANVFFPTNDSMLSFGIFSYLEASGEARLNVHHDSVYFDVDLNSVTDQIDKTYPPFSSDGNDGSSHEYDYVRLGLVDSVSVLNVEQVNNNINCEWKVTYRGWVSSPTPIGLAVSQFTKTDGVRDGFEFQNCYKVGKNGLEPSAEQFVWGEK